jgi:preprotein translocase subunit SecD
MKIKMLFLVAVSCLITSCGQDKIWDDTTKEVEEEFEPVKIENDSGQIWSDTTKEVEVTFKLVRTEHNSNQIELEEKVLIDTLDINRAYVAKGYKDRFSVFLEMTEEGRNKLSDITGKNIGRRLAILFNDQVVSSPSIQAKIRSGHVHVSGWFSKEEGIEIVKGIMKSKFNKTH